MADYYRLEGTDLPEGGGMATCALINCSLCGGCISSRGGPRYGCVCKYCGFALETGQLQRVVRWTAEEVAEIDKRLEER